MKNLNRNQLLSGMFQYNKDLIELKYTKHYEERFKERSLGVECIPTVVRIKDENMYCGKTSDGASLSSIVVRLNYTSSKNLFLCFDPRNGVVKTLWFKDKKKRAA